MWNSRIHGSAIVAKIFRGKAYNRCIFTHKLALEALSHLKWKTFGNWPNKNDKINKETHTPIKYVTVDLIGLFHSENFDNKLA